MSEQNFSCNDPEIRNLAYWFLDKCHDLLGRRGCNDFFEFSEIVPSVETRRRLVQAMHEWNGDPQEFDPNDLQPADFFVCGFVAQLFRLSILPGGEEFK